MPRYRVRVGKTVSHAGEVLTEGAILTLPREIGEDGSVACCVDEVDAKGRPVRPSETSDLEQQLALAQRHEHISILRAERARVAARLAELDDLIAAEVAWNDEQAAMLSTRSAAPTARKGDAGLPVAEHKE